MNKRMKGKAQFKKFHVKDENERGEEVIRVVNKQSGVEWEVRKFYWSLYRKEVTMCYKQDILNRIGEVKGISKNHWCNLEKEITMEEVSMNLKNTRNTVASGADGFMGSFYKVFWCFLKKIVLGGIHEIFKNKELPLSVRLGIKTQSLSRTGDP